MSNRKKLNDLWAYLADTDAAYCPAKGCTEAEEEHHLRQLADECGCHSGGTIQEVATAVLNERKRQAAARAARKASALKG